MNGIRADIQAPEQIVPSLLHINAQQIAKLTVQNDEDKPFGPTEIRLSLLGLSVDPVRIRIPLIAPGNTTTVTNSEFPLERLNRVQLEMLQQRDSGLPCELVATLADGQTIGTQAVHVLPPNAWLYASPPEVLAAFVNKESAAVHHIRQRARPYLRALLGVASFAEAIELTSVPLSTRVEQMTKALYHCLVESFQIHYEHEPRTYPLDWQKIRFHDRVLAERQGTCIDLALLLMACLESIHLNPILVVVRTEPKVQHTLVGCWLDKSRAHSTVVCQCNDIATWLPKPVGSNHLLLLDPTGFTVENGWPLSVACTEGLQCFAKDAPSNFVFAIDIAHARETSEQRKAISPMPFGEGPLLSGEGWAVVQHAERLARETQYDIVERAHLALSLLMSDIEVTKDLLGTRAQALNADVEQRVRQKLPNPKDVQIVQWTRSAQGILKQAGTLAEQYGAGVIGPVQLLHALLLDPGSTVSRSLTQIGINTQIVIAKLTDLARQDPQRDSYLDSKDSHDAGE